MMFAAIAKRPGCGIQGN